MGGSLVCCSARLPAILAVERQRGRQQFLVDDGQAVLIARRREDAAEQLRRGIARRDRAESGLGMAAGKVRQAMHEAEVRDFDVIAHEKQVRRFDVEMLQAVLQIEQIEHIRRLAQIAQQLRPWNAGQPLSSALGEQVEQALVGQFGDDDEFAVDDLDTFDR